MSVRATEGGGPWTAGGVSSSAAGNRSEAGYNMVVLMVAVTLLTVFTAAALPHWSHSMQREREAELIFRGWQYAEAIRVFQQRHGRYPTRLEELMEVEPRSIRKLWEDPMTESGEWGLVFQGDVAPQGGQGGRPLTEGGLPGGRPTDAGGARESGRSREPRAPRPGEERTVGPIVGVRSLSEEDAIRELFGEQRYDAWRFTVDRIGGSRISGVGPQGVEERPDAPRPSFDAGGRPVLPRVEWLGKPFPEGLTPKGGLHQGSGPGLQGSGPDGRPRRPPGGPRGGRGGPDRTPSRR